MKRLLAILAGLFLIFSTTTSWALPPRPPVRPIYKTILKCGSRGGETTRCRIDGWILRATLIENRSAVRCQYRRNWGVVSNAVWVTGGCKGTFDVRFQR